MLVRTVLRTASVTVTDYRCTASRHDRPFAEVHHSYTVAYVRRGSFGCTTRGKQFELVRGAVLVGAPGDEYTCTHDRAVGDECLSIDVAPALVDALGGTRAWRSGSVPPVAELMVLGELAQAAADGDAAVGVDEAAMWLAARYADLASDRAAGSTAPTPRDRRRAIDAARWIDACSAEPLDLDAIATRAGLSSFRFLRVFGSVLGVTPHQYLVRSRLRHAARMLAEDSRSITASRSTSASTTSRTSCAPSAALPVCHRDSFGAPRAVTARFSKNGSRHRSYAHVGVARRERHDAAVPARSHPL